MKPPPRAALTKISSWYREEMEMGEFETWKFPEEMELGKHREPQPDPSALYSNSTACMC